MQTLGPLTTRVGGKAALAQGGIQPSRRGHCAPARRTPGPQILSCGHSSSEGLVTLPGRLADLTVFATLPEVTGPPLRPVLHPRAVWSLLAPTGHTLRPGLLHWRVAVGLQRSSDIFPSPCLFQDRISVENILSCSRQKQNQTLYKDRDLTLPFPPVKLQMGVSHNG